VTVTVGSTEQITMTRTAWRLQTDPAVWVHAEKRNEGTMTENTENSDATKPSGPIEVWIRQKKATGFTCMVVYDDESTYEFDVVSRTLAAAQQEVTGRLMPGGYQPAGRWSPVETSRTFKPGEPRRGKPMPRRRVLNTAREWGLAHDHP
jgi:hypothetical protein